MRKFGTMRMKVNQSRSFLPRPVQSGKLAALVLTKRISASRNEIEIYPCICQRYIYVKEAGVDVVARESLNTRK